MWYKKGESHSRERERSRFKNFSHCQVRENCEFFSLLYPASSLNMSSLFSMVLQFIHSFIHSFQI